MPAGAARKGHPFSHIPLFPAAAMTPYSSRESVMRRRIWLRASRLGDHAYRLDGYFPVQGFRLRMVATKSAIPPW
jgi:hypothetical protein